MKNQSTNICLSLDKNICDPLYYALEEKVDILLRNIVHNTITFSSPTVASIYIHISFALRLSVPKQIVDNE